MTNLPPNLPPPPGDYGLPPPPGGHGQPPPPGGAGYSLPPPPGEHRFSLAPGRNQFALYSLIASTAGSLLCCGLGSIPGLILGAMALNQIKETGEGGRGMAIAGLIVGAVVVLFFGVAFMSGLAEL